MKDLNKKAIGRLLSLFIVSALVLFISASALGYWQAVIYFVFNDIL